MIIDIMLFNGHIGTAYYTHFMSLVSIDDEKSYRG